MSNPKQSRLSSSFWALNVSQFIGAMNDNTYRWVMALALGTRAATQEGQVSGGPIFIAGAVFAVPFIVFSSAAGILADRFSKRQMIVLFNLVAVLAMALGIFAFLADSPFLIYCVLFLMAAQSAFFSPNKYGILPELVPRDKLSYANGLLEMFVYLSIIAGTILGTRMFSLYGADMKHGDSTSPFWPASVLCVFIAAGGLLASLPIRDTGVRAAPKAVTPFFWKDVARNLSLCRPNRYLFMTLFAIGFFLLLGSFVQMNVTPYGTNVLGLSPNDAGLLFLALAVGIGIGSFLAGRISRRSVEIGLVPVGALMVALTLLFFVLRLHSTAWTILDLVLMGIGGGFYIVPLNTYVQDTVAEENRGEVIATGNFLSFCGLFIAAGLLFLLDGLGVGPAGSFVLLGCLTLVLTVAVVWVLPDFLIRFIGLVMARVIYRLETVGIENVPLKGGALLVCNHISFVDAGLLGATHQRRIRFLMEREFYNNPLVHWLFRLMQAIPISQNDPPKEIVRSIQAARRALDEGYLVCIFAEGMLTRTGYTMEFKRGVEHIVKGTNYPVIPICLHGIWGSILSYSHGRVLGRLPRPLRRRVTVFFGKPLPSSSNAFDVRQAVMELQSEAYERDRVGHQPLPLEFTQVARSKWRRFCMADTTGKNLTFGNTLTGSLALADALRPHLVRQQCVGLLLPSSVGGALANLAVSFLGKTPVNLNYTASKEALASAIRQCDISHVITSKAFLERFDFKDLPDLCSQAGRPRYNWLFLEDFASRITTGRKILALLKARLMPRLFLMDRSEHTGKHTQRVEDTAVIIFSSGSTGEPKGVMLTHYNIFSNVQSAQQVFHLNEDDVICGVLPFFHSFGYTVTLWLPLLAGVGVAYHYNPTEAERVAKLVVKHRCTFLATTPTFLQAYTRRVQPDQFKTLRSVITGAEKLKEPIATAFREKFGVMPMEGYGATELSPVASVNLPNVNVGGIEQKAYQPGSIGRPIPGVTMKVVSPDDLGRELGYGEDGLLLVKGPNVMKGYLGQPAKTAEVIREGWYVTGDIARISHDGFVTITDRLSRFSKIGGEMVPHQHIEEKLQALLGKEETVCAVTSAPDEKKGEQLVVLLTPEAGDPAEAHRLLAESNLPHLWVPSKKNFFTIDAIPILGTGKVDLKGLSAIARKKLRTDEA